MVVTIAQRKARKVEQLRSASQEVIAGLRAYALEHAGRFLIFGSVARGDIRPDSDFDAVVDFPASFERAARAYAEEACRRYGLTPDILLISDVSPQLMSRVRRDAVTLP
jgi:predicted nucleotidyltransferase